MDHVYPGSTEAWLGCETRVADTDCGQRRIVSTGWSPQLDQPRMVSAETSHLAQLTLAAQDGEH
jgi:hypothetical protein